MSTSPFTEFCGVTVCPSNDTPVLSVVVVTVALTCGLIDERASRRKASARRMSAAAIADDGFFAIAR